MPVDDRVGWAVMRRLPGDGGRVYRGSMKDDGESQASKMLKYRPEGSKLKVYKYVRLVDLGRLTGQRGKMEGGR